MKAEILTSCLIIIILLLWAGTSLVFASRYSKRKSTGALFHPIHRKSPYFCTEKFYICMKSSKDCIQPTVHGCENRLYRKYFCSKSSIHRKITDQEKRKYALDSPASRHLSGDSLKDSLDYDEYAAEPLLTERSPDGMDSATTDDRGEAEPSVVAGQIPNKTCNC